MFPWASQPSLARFIYKQTDEITALSSGIRRFVRQITRVNIFDFEDGSFRRLLSVTVKKQTWSRKIIHMGDTEKKSPSILSVAAVFGLELIVCIIQEARTTPSTRGSQIQTMWMSWCWWRKWKWKSGRRWRKRGGEIDREDERSSRRRRRRDEDDEEAAKVSNKEKLLLLVFLSSSPSPSSSRLEDEE